MSTSAAVFAPMTLSIHRSRVVAPLHAPALGAEEIVDLDAHLAGHERARGRSSPRRPLRRG